MMMADALTGGRDDRPWWKYGYVWLVLAGPIAVIIAGVITVGLALQNPDPVEENYYRKGIEINRRLEAKELLTAIEGRNHAATPVADGPQGEH